MMTFAISLLKEGVFWSSFTKQIKYSIIMIARKETKVDQEKKQKMMIARSVRLALLRVKTMNASLPACLP